jgi:hypothetical protein
MGQLIHSSARWRSLKNNNRINSDWQFILHFNDVSIDCDIKTKD